VVNQSIFKTMLAIARHYRLAVATFLFFGIAQTFAGLFALVLFQRLLDGLPGAAEAAALTLPLAGYLGLTALNHLLIYLEGLPRSILSNGPFLWVKLHALEKIARIDYLAYQDLGTGNLVQLVENGADATRNIFNGFYLEIIRDLLPQLVFNLIFIRFYDQNLFGIIAAGYGIFYLIAYTLMTFWRKEVEKLLENQENFSKFSVRAFMELVVFRVNGRFKAEIERVRGISDEIVRSRARIYLLQELFYTGFAFLVFLIQAGVVIQQVYLIVGGASTVGTLVALTAFISKVFAPISGFSMAYVRYKMDAVTFARFQKFLNLPDDPGLGSRAALRVGAGCITLDNVSFIYPGHAQAENQAVLKNFSYTFAGGKTTALVGESGGGKSTLIRLVLYLLKPTSGRILVDGQDLAEAQLAQYYESVSYIPQEPPVFDGTLLENLAFDRKPGQAQLEQVIRQVGLEEWVRGLPAGLQTVVGERGIKLSGGERQRLAFGRVLLQDPKIVILDEPTSALDSLTEDFVTRNLRSFFQGKTVLIVAHRLQTVTAADEILVLEDGEILQQGQFEALAAAPGRFRELWEKQVQGGASKFS
jgi:ABC-type multidrug transport system fused ATPase/permease subunit